MKTVSYQVDPMRHQSLESEVLLLCARQRLPEPSAARVSELCRGAKFGWNRLCRAAVRHQIAALVLTNLQRCGAAACMPSALAEQWKLIRARNILLKKNQVLTIRKLVDFFAHRSTRVMLLKGAALDAAVYEAPWYTQSDDLDLMVDRPCCDLGPGDSAALRTLFNGWSVEIDFTRHHDVDMNRVLDVDYGRIWADARPWSVGSAAVHIMSPEDMLLTACINLCRKRYGQLKGMMAVRELIGTHTKLDWDKLARSARECGANRIVYAALTVTAHVLGCDLPGHAPDVLRIGFARGWAIRGLGRSISAHLFRIPQPPREPTVRRLASHLLRIVSYRAAQLRREVQAHIELRRFMALYPKPAAAK
jgi:hypothetical protein